jgi:uncharacterized protein YceK
MKLGIALGIAVVLAGCSSVPSELLPAQQQRTGVHFTTKTHHLTASPWDLRYQQITTRHQAELEQYLPLFEQELQKLPAALLKVSGLQVVAFVRQLKVATQPRAAVPDYNHEVLYYDISPESDSYLRHVVHHEFYHMLEQQLYGSAYYQDPQWLLLNPEGFSYGKGGAATRHAQAAAFSHPSPGFINAYAMSGIEVIWASDSWQQVKFMFEQDAVLAAKLQLLIRQLQCKVPELKHAWPERIQPYRPADEQCPDVSTPGS